MVGKEDGVKVYNYNEVIIHVTNLINQNANGKIWVCEQDSGDHFIQSVYRLVRSQVMPSHKLYHR